MIKRLMSIAIIILVVIIGLGLATKEMLFPIKDKNIIEKYSKEYKVDPALVAAIINFETVFEPVKYEEGKACGVMKLTEKTGEELSKEIGESNLSKENIAENDTNIKLGTYYISKSNGKTLDEIVENWVVRNGVDENDKLDIKEYAKKYYTEKISIREKIYKILYFTF